MQHAADPLAGDDGGAGDESPASHGDAQRDDRVVLRILDGSRDRPALVEALTEKVLQGELELQQHGRPLTDPAAIRAVLEQELDGEPASARAVGGAARVKGGSGESCRASTRNKA